MAAPASRRGPRLVLAGAVLVGAATLLGTATERPGLLAVNSDVYRVAARAALAGGDLYAVHPAGFPQYRFVYPPVVVLAFLPLAPLSSLGALLAVVVPSVVAALALARLVTRRLRALGVPLGRLDAALVALFAVGWGHAVPTLYFGNVNLLLAAGTGAGLVWIDSLADRADDPPAGDTSTTDDPPADGDEGSADAWRVGGVDRRSLAGVALSLPALVKLFPAAAGLWAVRRRAWRVVGVAGGVGLLAVAGSLALFGVGPHTTYLESALGGRLAAGTPYPPQVAYVTLRRPLSVLGLTSPARGVVAAGLLAPVVTYANTRVRTPTDALVGLYALLAGVLLALPSYFVYLVFLVYPLVALSYLLSGRPRVVFLAGVAVASLPVTVDTAAALTAPVGGPGPLAGLLTAATPPLLGVGLTLLACTLQRRGRVTGKAE